MIHYSCDICGKPLQSDKDIRYVVKVEVYGVYEADDDFDEDVFDDDPELVSGDESEDLYDEDDEFDAEMEESDVVEYKTFRFDLCSECHKEYLQNPLFIKKSRKARFSEN